MNETDAILAVKAIKQLQGRHPVSSSDADDLMSELSNSKNSLHLSINREYINDGKKTKDMTIEEYRAYIEDKINRFIMHPQQKRVNYTVHITENGLHDMKSDKKYESHVLSIVRTAFSQPYYSPFSENCLLYFDDLENSCSMCWSSMKSTHTQLQPDSFPPGINDKPNETHSKDFESDEEINKKYIFKRFSPVSMIIPASRYEKAMYAYNIAPENQLKRYSNSP